MAEKYAVPSTWSAGEEADSSENVSEMKLRKHEKLIRAVRFRLLNSLFVMSWHAF